MDVFIAFEPQPGHLLVTPQPIFEYMLARGGALHGEYVVIAGWPVQFLPAGNPLLEEALAGAVEHDVEGTPVRVFTENTSRPLRSRPDAPRTKPACFNSSKPAPWKRLASKPLWNGTA